MRRSLAHFRLLQATVKSDYAGRNLLAQLMGTVASHSTVWQAAFERGPTTRRGRRGTYATFILIRAIVVTSPSSKLNVTFLQPTIGAHTGRTRQSREQMAQKAYSSCSDAICAMPAGSVPSRRFSPTKLPHHHQCEADAAQRTMPAHMRAESDQRKGTPCTF
jgi:hypothetical protein